MRKNIWPVMAVLFFYFAAFAGAAEKKRPEIYDLKAKRLLKTIHFNVSYPKGMRSMAIRCAEYAERAYSAVADALNYNLTDFVKIEIIPENILLSEKALLPPLAGTRTKWFRSSVKKTIALPLTASDHELENVITRELVYVFQHNVLYLDRSGDSANCFSALFISPVIIQGMAEYVASGFDLKAVMAIKDMLYSRGLPGISVFFDTGISKDIPVIALGQAFFYYLDSVYGKKVKGEFFKDIRDLGTAEKALKFNTGKNIKDFNTEFTAFYKELYPEKASLSDNYEKGRKIQFRPDENVRVVYSPVFSPDGKYIAFTGDDSENTFLYSVEAGNDTNIKAKRIYTVKGAAQHMGMHLAGRTAAWNSDSRSVWIITGTKERNHISLIDLETGKLLREIFLPFRSVIDISSSPENSNLAISAASNSRSDIYLINTKTNKLKRITDDSFYDRYPVLMSGENEILYCSNRKSDSGHIRFDIFIRNIETGKERAVLNNSNSMLQPGIINNKGDFVYISSSDETFNTRVYNAEKSLSDKFTDSKTGIFFPSYSSQKKKFIYVQYKNMKFNLYIQNKEK